MTARLLITFAAALTAWGASARVDRTPEVSPASRREVVQPRSSAVSDTALAELAAGRYWHAARILRAEGAHEGDPDAVLALAHAEAGWQNWPGVLELLEGADWLGGGDASGLYLLGRALDDAERWREAADALGQYSALVGSARPTSAAVLSRRARALWRVDSRDDARAALGALVAEPAVRSWSAVEMMLSSAAEGDTAGVAALHLHVVEPAARAAIWRAEADARLAAADSAGAAASFRRLYTTNEGSRRAEAAAELGRLQLAVGDTTEARALLLEAFQVGRGPTSARAAESLVDLGGFDKDVTLELGRVLDRAGDGARALRAYDRAVGMTGPDGPPMPEWARLERARLMGTVRPRQEAALEELRALRETTTDERIGARTLEVWRGLRQRQGQDAQVATLRRWLIDEYPGSPEAVELVWREGSGAEGRGALDVALARYEHIAEHARTSARAGESRMRAGQIHLRRAERQAAAEVFEAYLEDFPEGRRWQEAAYWAGRVRLELGDTTAGRAHLERAMREQPVEYYAVVAAELLAVPYTVDLPAGEGPSEPLWLNEGLARLDALTEAGLERGAEAEIDRLRDRARGLRPVMLALSDALTERGRTIDGINLGWALLEQEGTWDRELLRVTFPFPYRELVRREAAEWGIDPLLMAAIIRQESAFKADIVSRAGAIGLMQVMPPTGQQLARRHGPDPFSDTSLTRPEVNLHLGAAFFVDMSRRYDHDLPLVLSAYNAGPTRATAWRQFPEAADPLRFTERIPFDETRGYVKSVRRNLGLYRALYGAE
jgi:soluble lytic murein transglycosylase